MLDRLPLSTKLLRRVRAPYFDLGVASMAGRAPTYTGAAFAGNNVTQGRATTAAEHAHDSVYGGVLDAVPTSDCPESQAATVRCAKVAGRSLEHSIRRDASGRAGFSSAASPLLHHAIFADAALDEQCRPEAYRGGCRGTWFVASRGGGPGEVEVNLQVASLGNSRAWGIRRQSAVKRPGFIDGGHQEPQKLAHARAQGAVTEEFRSGRPAPPTGIPGPGPRDTLQGAGQRIFSALEERRIDRKGRMFPLSIDHRPTRPEENRRIRQAGGHVDHDHDVVRLPAAALTAPKTQGPEKDEWLDISRSLGFVGMKRDQALSPREQQIIAVPDVMQWTMRPGDTIVLATHSLFETRGTDPSSVDAVTELVIDSMQRLGRAPHDVAADLCDFALRYGSSRDVSVVVAQCTEDAGAAAGQGASDTTIVRPGPLYSGALAGSQRYHRLVLAECARCGVTLPGLLMRRFLDIAPLLRDEGSHALSLPAWNAAYPAEAGGVSAVLADEADLFWDCPFGPEGLDPAAPTKAQSEYFDRLARLVTPKE